jgi:4Fe-4S ferredoxin
MITRHHRLELDRIKCVGCELCPAVCPPEAIAYVPGTIEDGKLVVRPTVDIDPEKCNFCGECVIVCPVNALSMEIDGEEKVPVWEYEVFPVLTKQITWDGTKLPKEKADMVVEVCPTDVITVEATRTKTGKVRTVKGVQVDESDCIYCKQCEIACPEAFAATHPFEGLIRLHESLCPSGCQACADVCPSHALMMSEGKLVLDDRFCLYCGACQLVCPEPEALIVRRHRIRHTPTKSGAWIYALERLVSAELAAEELELKSQAKRRSAMDWMPGVPKAE